ncbi:phospholipase A2-like [Bombus fervidus]|uniref:phospholipase A2-like n=1 Tax=Bombus fervidus TaxID=203811 RepID=UPI003AB7372C
MSRNIMISTIYTFLLCTTVTLALESDSNSITLKETYITSMEKSIQILINSEQAIHKKIVSIKNYLKGLASDMLPKNENTRKKSTIGDVFNSFKSKIKAIYPGTYWCGDGNVSPNGEDLGLFDNTDACCKTHDLCLENISAGEKREGLLNNGIFTRSSCECDRAFYRCLKEADNIFATNIGRTYFNVLRPQCFQTDYPIVDCKKYARHRLMNNKCDEYNYNFSLPQIMQWFDNPDF